MKRFALSTLWMLIFLAGILLELSLSGGVLWGEIEARADVPQIGDSGLLISCPLMLSPSESGTVSTSITNTLNEETSPVVTEEINHSSGQQLQSQTLDLAPHEKKTLHWTVDSSDRIFGRLIIVNIIQSRYSDLSSRQGACGILVLSLFKLNGINTFSLISLAGLLCTSIGAAGWLRVNWPLNGQRRSTAQACGIMAGVVTTGLLAAVPRWWGLTLFFDFLTLLIMAVVLTEFVIFPRRSRK